MPSDPTSPPPQDGRPPILEGWKTIAAYFGRDVRTVQRWERAERLPIRRHNHAKQATAYAIREELDAWRAGREAQISERGADGCQSEASGFVSRRYFGKTGTGVLVSAAVVAAVSVTAIDLARRPTPRDPLTSSSRTANQMFAQGTRLYAEGHYRDSVRPFETAAQFDADFALAWAALAKAYGRAAQPGNAGTVTGNPAIRASDAATHALALAPTIAESHLAAALAGRANRDLARWRSEARKAIAIDPRTAEAYLVLADSYNALIQYGCDRDQNPELADELYAKGLALEPSLPPDTRATNLRYLGRYNECIDLITQAQRKNPPAPAQSEVRGRCKLMLGDIDGAAQDITPLEHNRRTGTANSFIDLGWLNLRRGNTEEGVQQLELAADIQPNAQNELTIAYVYGDVSDPNHAVAHLRRAFALEPTCTTMVRTVIAFRQLRTFPAVQSLLTEPSFR